MLSGNYIRTVLQLGRAEPQFLPKLNWSVQFQLPLYRAYITINISLFVRLLPDLIVILSQSDERADVIHDKKTINAGLRRGRLISQGRN